MQELISQQGLKSNVKILQFSSHFRLTRRVQKMQTMCAEVLGVCSKASRDVLLFRLIYTV